MSRKPHDSLVDCTGGLRGGGRARRAVGVADDEDALHPEALAERGGDAGLEAEAVGVLAPPELGAVGPLAEAEARAVKGEDPGARAAAGEERAEVAPGEDAAAEAVEEEDAGGRGLVVALALARGGGGARVRGDQPLFIMDGQPLERRKARVGVRQLRGGNVHLARLAEGELDVLGEVEGGVSGSGGRGEGAGQRGGQRGAAGSPRGRASRLCRLRCMLARPTTGFSASPEPPRTFMYSSIEAAACAGEAGGDKKG